MSGKEVFLIVSQIFGGLALFILVM